MKFNHIEALECNFRMSLIKTVNTITKILCMTICLNVAQAYAQMPNNDQIKSELTSPLTQQEIDTALSEMRVKLDHNLHNWSHQLKRKDFDRTGKNLELKASKQTELCKIYQTSIDDTYALALKHRHRMSQGEQAVVDHRDKFIQYLGFKNNQINTKLGFSCRLF